MKEESNQYAALLKHVSMLVRASGVCENSVQVTNWVTVGTESIQTPLNFSLFVILQPFAKII